MPNYVAYISNYVIRPTSFNYTKSLVAVERPGPVIDFNKQINIPVH